MEYLISIIISVVARVVGDLVSKWLSTKLNKLDN